MNKTINKAKESLIKQKKRYLFLIILTIVGIIAGIIFTTILKEIDKKLVTEQLSSFFNEIKTGNIHYTKGFINSISSNILYCVGIWLLGISLIGFPIILFLHFMKGFTVGFIIGSIFANYHLLGIIGIVTYLFPHHILNLLLSIFLTFYAMSFGIKLFSYLFLKKEINFKEAMRKYLQILMISLTGFLISSLFEIYLSPFLIKLFTNIIK